MASTGTYTGNAKSSGFETGFLFPPSIDDSLPEQHLARFVVEVIDGLDLSAMVRSYRGSGSASYHPALLLGILVYGYATGMFSRRKLERATYDSVAFRFITANEHPDHDTIATFRRRFLRRPDALRTGARDRFWFCRLTPEESICGAPAQKAQIGAGPAPIDMEMVHVSGDE